MNKTKKFLKEALEHKNLITFFMFSDEIDEILEKEQNSVLEDLLEEALDLDVEIANLEYQQRVEKINIFKNKIKKYIETLD